MELPISIQTFEHIRREGKIYVDKTEFIHEMVTKGKYYFLSRPRRFGKSIVVSTLKAFFQGKKELFEGLYIYDKIEDWKTHPVIHFDFSLISYKDGKTIFQESLLSLVRSIGRNYDLELQEKNHGDAFVELVQRLHKNHGQVVVLVDEYDKAIVDVLENKAAFEENRDILRALFGTMKALDVELRFVFLTGVSRFAKVNVFSGLNNLDDISMTAKFSGIVGFTHEELIHYFTPYLEAVRKKFSIDSGLFWETIKYKYNGFSWDGEVFLYNPFSLFKFLNDQEFGNYWFSSGTPKFLVDLVMLQKQLPENLEDVEVFDLTGGMDSLESLPLIPILFQTGYLSIKKVTYDGFERRFHLAYPNDEVRQSFILYLAGAFLSKPQHTLQPHTLALRDALLEEKTEAFIQILQSFLADIPSRLHIKKEAYYHSLFYMILRLLGVQLQLEKETDKGRIDAVLELSNKVYIIELKFATNSRVKKIRTLTNQVIKQIELKKYYEPYLGKGKKIILLGIGFLDKKVDARVKYLEL